MFKIKDLEVVGITWVRHFRAKKRVARPLKNKFNTVSEKHKSKLKLNEIKDSDDIFEGFVVLHDNALEELNPKHVKKKVNKSRT